MITRKKILVTGSTGAIGSVLSEHLAMKGYNLILTGRIESKLTALVGKLKQKYDVGIEATVSDFSNSESYKNVTNLLDPKLEGLVLMPPQVPPTEDCLPPKEEWAKIFEQSFTAPLMFLKSCIPFLEKSDRGKVVVVSGISSAQVLSHYATSNVLRTSWLAQAKTLAYAYGPKRVHFNTLSLGGVLTEKYQERLRNKAKTNNKTFDDQMDVEVSNVPLRKYAAPEEVAASIEGLLSSFSDHITGMNIMCDGGFTRSY